MFPEGSDRGGYFYLKWERVQKSGCKKTEGNGKIVCVISELCAGDVKEINFRADASGFSRRGEGVNSFT